MNSDSSKQKSPITYKKAAVIVVALHVVGFVVLFGWGSYNSNRAKVERKLKMAAAVANYNPDKTFWNTHDKKLKVVAVSPVKVKPVIKPAAKEQFIDKVSNLIIGVRKNFDNLADASTSAVNEAKDVVYQIEKRVEVPKPTKQPVVIKQTVPKARKSQQNTLPNNTSTTSYTKHTVTEKGKTYTQYEQYEEIRRPVEQIRTTSPSLPRVVPMRVVPPPPPPSQQFGYMPSNMIREFY